MEIPDGLKALNFTSDDVPALVKGAIPQVKYYFIIYIFLGYKRAKSNTLFLCILAITLLKDYYFAGSCEQVGT